METCSIKVVENTESLAILSIEGYLSKGGGELLKSEVRKQLEAGCRRLVFDFSQCPIISSPGVAALLEIVCQIREDYRGTCVLVGLDKSKTNFLTMTGVIPLTPTAETIEAGCALLKS